MASNTSYHIAVIGPFELVSGLQSVGITPLPATTKEEVLAQLHSTRHGVTPYACVCITESMCAGIPHEELYPKDAPTLPVILTIPDLQSDKKAGLEKLRDLAKRAIGTDIFN